VTRLYIAAFILGCMPISRGAFAADFGIVTLTGNEAKTSALAAPVAPCASATRRTALALRSLGTDFKDNCDSASMD